MLRVIRPHTLIRIRALTPCARVAHRALSGSAVRFRPDANLNKERNDLVKGTEGLHKNDAIGVPIHPPVNDEVKGDWVLFHPVYTPEELKSVQVMHREAKGLGDKVAVLLVKALRRGFDIVSLYRHKEIPPNHNMTLEQLRKGGYVMDEAQWLYRILFLETIAGVPGFVAAMLRHLRSLRVMKRDAGWIHTLLNEAENERIHLMTFMTLKEPTIWFRVLVLGAQGVFANAFFLCYLMSPRICHRFVASLEEEATLTYTRVIEEMELGRIPEWTDKPAPAIAIDYWRLPKDAKLLDVMYAVRSDETTHRFVNHTFANIDYKTDINPFALGEPDMHVKGVKLGFTREEAAEYLKKTKEHIDRNSEK